MATPDLSESIAVSTLALLLFAAPVSACSQGHAAYEDDRGRFHIWNGVSDALVDHNTVRDWQLGPDYVAYTDHSGELHLYQNGRLHPMGVIPDRYWATRDLLLYQVGENVTIVDDGKKHHLLEQQRRKSIKYHVGVYSPTGLPYVRTVDLHYTEPLRVSFGDSIAGFRDRNDYLHVYSKNRITELEQLPVSWLGAGSNVLCWINAEGHLCAFWKDRTGVLDEEHPTGISLGTNTIAWVDRHDRLRIFHKGRSTEPDGGYLPYWFATGDDMVAWINRDLAELRLFYHGRTRRLLGEEPLSVGVRDALVWFVDGNRDFHVFYRGEKQLLETYDPGEVKAEGDILVYKDLDGRLKSFYKGESIQVTKEIVETWGLNGDMIWWTTRPNLYAFLNARTNFLLQGHFVSREIAIVARDYRCPTNREGWYEPHVKPILHETNCQILASAIRAFSLAKRVTPEFLATIPE